MLASGCDRASEAKPPAPSIGERPKQIIDAAEATRQETEKYAEEQRKALEAALGPQGDGQK